MNRAGSFEAMLLRWSETSSGGATITLQLADADELEPFKLMTLAKGKQAGQILDISWREMDPDNAEADARISRPLIREKGGALSELAGRWCNDPDFQEWLNVAYPKEWEMQVERYYGTHNGPMQPPPPPHVVAAAVVRDLCGVGSRAQLDHSDAARAWFNEKIRGPYQFKLGAMQGGNR